MSNDIFRFSVSKLDADKVFEVDLSFQLKLDGDITNFNIATDTRVPIPICDPNAAFTLPGDWSITAFVRAVGKNVGQSAVEAVWRNLGIDQVVSGEECSLLSTSTHATGKFTLI